VSSLQRYLATMPGVLEWAWDAVRPALTSGVIQETGWRLAETVRLSPAAPVSPATLREMGCRWGWFGCHPEYCREFFVRVSPVNLMTGACLAGLLNGAASVRGGISGGVDPTTDACRRCREMPILRRCRPIIARF